MINDLGLACLIKCCDIYVEKLVVAQFIKKLSIFYENQKFCYHVHNSASVDPVMGKFNPCVSACFHMQTHCPFP
jgi:hypothetical protein